ncbi:MAG: glycosyltransferase family 4 protein [Polyangiaceae bacterium]|nr:glycosyltransferase family 4 protein [Polyangiaceae bacterium]
MPEGVTIVAERAMPSRGGLAMATSRIAEQARDRGEEVHLVVTSRDVAPGACGHQLQDGVHVHPVGRLPDDGDASLALADHAADVARTAGSTLVHGIYALGAGFTATVVAARLGLPSIVSLRGNDLDRGLYRRQELPLLSHALQRATLVTGVTRALCRTAAAVFERETHFIANSVDADRFRPERRDNSLVAALGLGTDRVLGYSGELREKKGLRFLLPAFAELVRDRPLRLLLIGGVRRDAEAAFDEFGRLAPEARARVHVAEWARSPKRLSALLALCDLCVFPSLQEGMPNAVLEAMAAERPVLATAVGGHTDLLEHGKTGALLPLSQLDALPEAIAEMLDLRDDERRRLGKAARAHVVAHHHPAAETAAWAEVYRLARAAGGPRHARVVEHTRPAPEAR